MPLTSQSPTFLFTLAFPFLVTPWKLDLISSRTSNPALKQEYTGDIPWETLIAKVVCDGRVFLHHLNSRLP